jgi:hypothetical protein
MLTIFYHIALYCLVDTDRRFRGTFSAVTTETVTSQKTLNLFKFTLTWIEAYDSSKFFLNFKDFIERHCCVCGYNLPKISLHT